MVGSRRRLHIGGSVLITTFVLVAVSTVAGCLAVGRFSSPNDWPPFSLDPPQGWGVSMNTPSGADPSWAADFLGPTTPGRSLRPNTSVRVFPPRGSGGPYASYHERLTELQQFIPGLDGEAIRTGSIVVAGEPALEIVYNYMDVPPDFKPREPARAWDVITEHNGYIFEISYSAPREDFDKYAPLFQKMLDTFRFER